MAEQLALTGMPRARVQLAEETEDVKMLVPRRVALAVGADPEGAVRALREELERDDTFVWANIGETQAAHGGLEVDPEGFIGYTRWEAKEPPPGAGLWDVTDHATGAKISRWWFGGVWWVMGPDPTNPSVPRLNHRDFAKQFAWRGLRSAPTWPYPCPPYSLTTIPKGCQLDVRVLNLLAAERAATRDSAPARARTALRD